jgi:hypothetical protein
MVIKWGNSFCVMDVPNATRISAESHIIGKEIVWNEQRRTASGVQGGRTWPQAARPVGGNP